jgi:hypothetical protein|tara:strand:+ start:321 stop:1217 length:897 start_codon:yes stop_codon:yes gene_type:complete
MDNKCAPGVKYNDGSCLTKDNLIEIAENFPKKNIKTNVSKKELVDTLQKEFKNKYNCKDQLCWLDQTFVKRLNNENINKFTFRPFGPNKKYDWLSTLDINAVVEQYEKNKNDFIFLGAVPYDFQEIEPELDNMDFDKLRNGELNENFNQGKKTNKMGMVINLDDHTKGGSHWVSLFANFDKNQIYFFDSFAKPPGKKIKKFINKIAKYMYKNKYNKDLFVNHVIKKMKNQENSTSVDKLNKFDIRHNTIQHQFNNSECGVYSINFLVRLANGETFDDITKNILGDKFINNCRKTYFRN